MQLSGVTAKDVIRLFEQQEKLWYSVVGEGGREWEHGREGERRRDRGRGEEGGNGEGGRGRER